MLHDLKDGRLHSNSIIPTSLLHINNIQYLHPWRLCLRGRFRRSQFRAWRRRYGLLPIQTVYMASHGYSICVLCLITELSSNPSLTLKRETSSRSMTLPPMDGGRVYLWTQESTPMASTHSLVRSFRFGYLGLISCRQFRRSHPLSNAQYRESNAVCGRELCVGPPALS